MKKKLLFAGVAFMALCTIQAQEGVGIGKSILPDATAVLDVGSDTKGILIPRVNLLKEDDTTTIKGGTYPESLLVYHKKGTGSVLDSGYYFWNGTLWKALMSKSSVDLSETLTTLKVDIVNDETVLTYNDEKNKDHAIEISTELKKSDNFKAWINSLVSAKASGVTITEGDGITVTPDYTGSTPEAPKTEYIISANLSQISLTGDVSGSAASNTVDKIKGIEVVTPTDVNFGEALIYGSDKKWKTGKPSVGVDNISNKASLSVGGGLVITSGGNDALLTATSLEIQAKGIQTDMIADGAVTAEKIGGGKDKQILVSDASGGATWINQDQIKPTAQDLDTDGIIVVGAADSNENKAKGALLEAAKLSIKNASIGVNQLADGAGVEYVLTTDDQKRPVWKPKTDIATKADLTVDGVIQIVGNTTNIATGAVLTSTELKIKDLGIEEGKLAADAVTTTKIKNLSVTNDKVDNSTLTIDKLATDIANKNKHLATDKNGAPVWESKHLTITTATPVATNEVVDGFKVYTLKIANGTVKEPNATGTALGYNSLMEAISITNLQYLLTAQVYNKDNKLLVSGVTDVTNTAGASVSFRFGVNNMYSVLPVGTEYKVVLKYVSNEAAD